MGWVDNATPRPSHPPLKKPGASCKEVGYAQGRSGRVRKNPFPDQNSTLRPSKQYHVAQEDRTLFLFVYFEATFYPKHI